MTAVFSIQEIAILASLVYAQDHSHGFPFGISTNEISGLSNIPLDRVEIAIKRLKAREYIIQGESPDHDYAPDGKEVYIEREIDAYEILPKGIASLFQNISEFVENTHGLTYDIPEAISDHLLTLYESAYPNQIFASDRFVSVRDNQEPFDQLERSLDEIIDEFARDHNRGKYAIEDAETHLINIEIIKAQIKRGWVNLDELRDQLRPSLQKLEADCKSLAIIGGTMLGTIAAALKAISMILGG